MSAFDTDAGTADHLADAETILDRIGAHRVIANIHPERLRNLLRAVIDAQADIPQNVWDAAAEVADDIRDGNGGGVAA